MPLTLRWTTPDELDRVAETRWQCFGHMTKDLQAFKDGIRADKRAVPGDYLLAERDGLPVGTATSQSMTMWVRGSPLPCQGVAYVGTAKTHRRAGTPAGESGVASAIMRETIRMARERGEVVSALMPFRASFYEHFGYGIVERRVAWTIPLPILPTGNATGYRFLRDDDLPAIAALRQHCVEHGQCDIERTPAGWELRTAFLGYGAHISNYMEVVDQPASGGHIDGYCRFTTDNTNGKTILRVEDNYARSHAAFLRMLHFFRSLSDQYAAVQIVLPVDQPLNWLLRETQIPHRPVNHATAEARPFTRMQVRVLDHLKFLSALHVPPDANGAVTIAVREVEGHVAKFRFEYAGGHASAKPSDSSADIECPDRVWAAIACGDMPATQAVRLALADEPTTGAATTLDALSRGPVPFCNEYF